VRLAGINIGGPARGSPDFTKESPNTNHVARGDFGLIGLAVMGQNLILNAADHGFNVIAFNRTISKVDHFLANEAKGKLFYRDFPENQILIMT
jgi:6-phosphogluconate dehydrogenase